jgi:hypothetical protein
MVGAMCEARVWVPVIQVTVPSATRPAKFSMAVPSAASSTGGASTSGTLMAWKALTVIRSPLTLTVSPRSSGISPAKYSFM